MRILRRNGFKAPIIMLTGHDTNSDTILGLESGANDYVTKPSALPCCLRGSAPCFASMEQAKDYITIGPYTFRPSSKLLLNLDGSKVRLTEKETSILLRYLYRAGQRPVSRETFCRKSGPTTRKSPRTRSTHIYHAAGCPWRLLPNDLSALSSPTRPDARLSLARWLRTRGVEGGLRY